MSESGGFRVRRSAVAVLGVVCCAVAAVTLSCTTQAAPAQPPHRDRAPAAQLTDRDERAVVDALRRLDMCALLATVVPAATVVAGQSPSSCQSPGLDVAVAKHDTDERLRFPSRLVGGAKVYLAQGPTSCGVWLPVSFRLAIEFTGEQACDAMADALAPAVTALADLAAVEAAPRWEACAALRTVGGVTVGSVEVLDSCSDRKGDVALTFQYRKPATMPPDGWRKDTVDGVEVWLLEDRGSTPPNCVAEWIVGPPVTSHADDDLVAHLGVTDCGRVTALVAPLVATLRKTPGEGSPQRPLLYGPDDPDSPYPGGCAYVDRGDRTDCAPYAGTSLPPDDDIVSATDPNASCAVAMDAVATGFGAGMVPVTMADHCYFVSPERLFQVEFDVWPDALRDVTEPGPEQVTIAGHPGFVKPGQEPRTPYRVWLAAATSADRPGTLRFDITPGPLATGPLPAEVIAKVEPVLAEIVRQHFSG